MIPADSTPDLDPAVAAFGRHLATRDQPAPMRFDRASVEARIAAGISGQFPHLHHATCALLAQLFYGFFTERYRTMSHLAAEFQRHPTLLRRQLRPFLAAGWLTRAVVGPDARQKAICLTRAGEDWLQTLVQAPNSL